MYGEGPMIFFRLLSVIALVFIFSGCSTARYPGVNMTRDSTATLSVGESGCKILLEGRIDGSAETAFETAVESAKKNNCRAVLVELNSPGGLGHSGMQIGNRIRELRYATVIPPPSRGICNSACGFVYIGGVSRFVTKESRMGLHLSSERVGGNICEDTSASMGYSYVVTYIFGKLPDKAADTYKREMEKASCRTLNQLSSSDLLRSGIATRMIQ
jgi:hypothetical protein